MSTDTLSRLAKLEAGTLKRREVFDLLKDVGLAITSMLGRSCEVVIHDLRDLEGMLHSKIEEATQEGGIPVAMMRREDNPSVVRRFDERGLFLMKGAVQRMVNALDASRYAIHSCLDEITTEMRLEAEMSSRGHVNKKIITTKDTPVAIRASIPAGFCLLVEVLTRCK